MRAIQLDAPGPPEALHLRQLPVPVARPGWVRIRVEAFGLLPNLPIPCNALPAGPLAKLPCTAAATTSPMGDDTLALLLGA